MDNNNRDEVSNENFKSPLGNLEYWEDFYTQEISQWQNNAKLIGEIWFGKAVQSRIVKYICNKFPKDRSILDIGSGNGAMLYQLAKNDYKVLYGSDYSENSVALATEILKEKSRKKGIDYHDQIIFYQEDINHINENNRITFDLIHDKGTFDAFMSKKDNQAESYIAYIQHYSHGKDSKGNDSTRFILTSCNYSKNELLSIFTKENKFNYTEEIPHKTFSFGGSTGQIVTTLIFHIN